MLSLILSIPTFKHAKPKPIKIKGRVTHYVSYPWEDIQETREHRGKPWHVVGNSFVWVIQFERSTRT